MVHKKSVSNAFCQSVHSGLWCVYLVCYSTLLHIGKKPNNFKYKTEYSNNLQHFWVELKCEMTPPVVTIEFTGVQTAITSLLLFASATI